MNGLGASLSEVALLAEAHPAPGCDILLCPPATLLERMSAATKGSAIATGGQDCHAAASGAHTGDIAANMLVDAGASHVIVGHSERRADHGETSAEVRAKAEAALAAGLCAVVCIGETLAQREAGETLAVIGDQLAHSVPDNGSAEVHDFLRARLQERFGADIGNGVRLLYGGSVKPGNAPEIFAVSNVDGALVGGASLKAADFSPIIAALEAST